MGFVERAEFLATMGECNWRWDGRQLEMTKNTRDDRRMGDGGNDPQRATSVKGTRGHIQMKHAAQQPGPMPGRCSRLRCLAVHPLVTRCGNNRLAKLAMRGRTAGIAHEVDTWHRHERRTLHQECQRGECDAGGAVRPRAGKGRDTITNKHFKRYFSVPLPDGVVPCGRSAGDSRTRKDGFLWCVKTIVVAGFFRAFAYAFFGSTLLDVGSREFFVATAALLAVALLPLAHRGLREKVLVRGFRAR